MTFAIILASFIYVIEPVAITRETEELSSKIATRTYYGEEVVVEEDLGELSKVRTKVDNYQGYIKTAALLEREEEYPKGKTLKINSLHAHIYDREDTEWGEILSLPFETSLEVVEELPQQEGRWIKVRLLDGRIGYIQRGDVTFDLKTLTKEKIILLSYKFLGLPYTWGGRSGFGYDCSGFTQMLYRQMGIFLPRDAKDQASFLRFKEVSENQLLPADLIFFGYDEKRIRHVGFYLGNGKFIHANRFLHKPYIIISDLSEKEFNGGGTYPYRTFRSCFR